MRNKLKEIQKKLNKQPISSLSKEEIELYFDHRLQNLISSKKVLVRNELEYLLGETGPGPTRIEPDLFQVLAGEEITAHSPWENIPEIKNPFYTGEMRWRKLINKGNHQPLINKDLFERVQIVMAEHNRYACRRRKFNFILRGFMFCFICKQRYTAEHHFKKNKSYYHGNRAGDQIKCSDKYAEVWDLEKQVADLFQQIQFSQSFIDKVIARVEKIYKGRTNEINKEKGNLSRKNSP